MEENHAMLFLHFLEKMAQEKKFDANDVQYMGLEFSKVVESIDSDQKLLDFITPFLEDYPEFLELKDKLVTIN